ncbi:unnamed protein product [Sphagnum jensenii]|uniref:VLIG-type G domain-containing protein n=1 Tax=Sphagnum jensenii TaxID=128206 RepID=A0ABP0XA00_9BRYO
MEDEELITRASSGLALCGIHVGSGDGGRRASKQLLCKPTDCKLIGPRQEFKMETLLFSSIESSRRFCDTVKKSGWSPAVTVSAPLGCLLVDSLSLEWERNKREEKKILLDQLSTEACQLQCWYYPKASFNIPRHQMRLSEEAIDDLRRLLTHADAEIFLRNYNSHVSTGRYHVGGLLLQGVTIETKSAIKLETLLETAATNLKGGVKFGCMGFHADVQVMNMHEAASSSSERITNQRATMGTVVIALGPQTTDESEFKTKLEDRSNWYVIDHDEDAMLVPVWEIAPFGDFEDLQKPRNMLREAWQRSSESEAPTNARLHELLVSSYHTRSTRLNSLISPPVNKEEAIARLKSKLDVIARFHDVATSPSSSPRDAKEILAEVWVTSSSGIMDSVDQPSNWDPRVLLFEHPDFGNLLLYIAQSTDPEMEIAKKLVRQLINKEVQLLLIEANVSLQEPVRVLLRDVDPVAPELTMPFHPVEYLTRIQLVERLKDLVTNWNSGLTTDVVTAIKACLRRDANAAVKNVMVKHGFNGNGDREMEDVTKQQVESMILELQDASDSAQSMPREILPPEERASFTQSSLAVPPYNMDHKTEYTYNGDVLVDRPLKGFEHTHGRMMDCLRHRMEPFESTRLNQPTSSNSEPDDGEDYFASSNADNYDNECDKLGVTTNDGAPDSLGPFEILVQLLISSDLLAQIALFQLLLEQRFSVPLVVPHVNTYYIPPETHSDFVKGFSHLVEALNFVQVKLANQEILSIGEDRNLPRVVFVSNRDDPSRRESADMASEIMNCHFVSKYSKSDSGEGPIAELGVGFLAKPNDQILKHMPCLVLCVWGPHGPLENFLQKFADIVIVETEPDQKPRVLPWSGGHHDVADVLYWNINSTKRSRNNKDNVQHTYGSFNDLTKDIAKYLMLKLKSFKGRSGGGNTLEECLSQIRPLNQQTSICNVTDIEATQLEGVRDSLKLQKRFATEAHTHVELLRQNGHKVDFVHKKTTPEVANDQLKLPILKLFIGLLSEHQRVKRQIGIVHFQLSIDKKLQSSLKKATDKVNVAFGKFQQNLGDSQLKDEYRFAKQEYVDRMLGLEHLWRELSHIFTTDPSERQIPRLAAYHLLDGFPLEILDGDAAMFHKLWVDTVLTELDTTLSDHLKRKPKVFVLSVLGLQSSGKSTLLNLMFGTQLKTSAGQCTRGVYLQLVKSERTEYDYVLLLDTEGIRAPEFSGTKDVALHDNRLATFTVLPADACIVMVTNEEDNGLKEVLPMVMLAFKGSAMAEERGKWMQAKLFFVYRSVDTNDVEKLQKNQRKLQEDLRAAAFEVANTRIHGIDEESSSEPSIRAAHPVVVSQSTMIDTLNNFQINVQEVKSDVKYFGNLKKGTVPPLDIPDWDYGTKVVALRNYIHNRVSENGRWVSHGLVEWRQYLELVWNCIETADFELGFLNCIEYMYYNDLRAKLLLHQQRVGKKYVEEFEILERKLQAEKNLEESFNHWWNIFRHNMQETITNEQDKVGKLLEERQSQIWKVEETNRWYNFRSDQERHWKGQLQELIDSVFKFDKVVEDYNNDIKKEIESNVQDYQFHITSEDDRERKMMERFGKLFKEKLENAESLYPPLGPQVPQKVLDMYRQHIVGRQHPFNLIKNDDEMIKDNRKPSFYGQYLGPLWNRGRKLDIDKELASMVENYLQDAKQYADHLVSKVIDATEKLLQDIKSREHQHSMHTKVQGMLTQQLKAIQQEWDKHHNVAKRLETEHDQLWRFFKNCANRVGGTVMLSDEVQNLLDSKLVDSFKILLSNKIADKLQDEAWVLNWKIMRAHLDLHLVALMEVEETDELLQCVGDGALHYRRVLHNLIQIAIQKEHIEENILWKRFVKSIQEAIISAYILTQTSNDRSKSTKFIQGLKRNLANDVKSPELAKSISLVHNSDVYSKTEEVIDFEKVAKTVCVGVERVQINLTSCEIEEMVGMVKERMINCASEVAKQRCEATCPHCQLTCVHPEGHDAKHNTLHQPAGLAGSRYTESSKLVHRTCSQSVALDETFRFHLSSETKITVPFEDFEKYYPNWTVPTEGLGTVEVREHIFAHYQRELITKYPSAKINSNIPSEYKNHDLKALRCKLENIIKSNS